MFTVVVGLMSVGSSLPVVELDSINTAVQLGITSVHSAADGNIFYITLFIQLFIFCCLFAVLINECCHEF